MGEKLLCLNKKARLNYHIEETLEAGIVLRGHEVKSLRLRKVNLGDSFARIKEGEIFLHNAHISPYDYTHHMDQDPTRPRKLLLHQQEIKRLIGKVSEKGYTLIPLRLYFKDNWAKVEMGLGKGKKIYDRREELKKRDLEREIRRDHMGASWVRRG